MEEGEAVDRMRVLPENGGIRVEGERECMWLHD